MNLTADYRYVIERRLKATLKAAERNQEVDTILIQPILLDRLMRQAWEQDNWVAGLNLDICSEENCVLFNTRTIVTTQIDEDIEFLMTF